MISLALTTALYLSPMQDAATLQLRRAYGGCLTKAASASIAKKVEPAEFEPEARTACAAEETKLLGALVAFDLKSGSKRAEAEESAKLQIDDYIFNANETYKDSYEGASKRSKAAEEASAPATPAPVAEPDTR